ncbi:hypothetical protein Efla_003588 [Eimeria flavescens]
MPEAVMLAVEGDTFEPRDDEDDKKSPGQKQPQPHEREDLGADLLGTKPARSEGKGGSERGDLARDTVDTVDERLGPGEINFGAADVLFEKAAGKAGLADKARRLHQVGPARPGSLQPEGVRREETWRQGRLLNEFSHGFSPPPQTPRLHGREGKLGIDLRRTQADSACADGGLTARATRCPDSPPDGAVDPQGTVQRERLPGASGTEGLPGSWVVEFDPGRDRLKPLTERLSSVSSSPSTRVPSSIYESRGAVRTGWEALGSLCKEGPCKKLSEVEQQYAIYDQKLLALVRALERRRRLLLHAEVTAYTDHRGLQYLLQHEGDKPVKGRLARWLEFSADFDRLTIKYRPGSENLIADALTRLTVYNTKI